MPEVVEAHADETVIWPWRVRKFTERAHHAKKYDDNPAEMRKLLYIDTRVSLYLHACVSVCAYAYAQEVFLY